MPSLPELRLADLLTLLSVQRTRSISGAARELQVTPSQVSKAVVRLERYFGVQLLERGARGVAVTPDGRQILPRVASAVEQLRSTNRGLRGRAPTLELTVGAPSYVLANVLPGIALQAPSMRVRGLELSPAHLRAYISENAFDIAVVPGAIPNRPAAWTHERAASVRVVLLARPSFAVRLGPPPLTVDRVRQLPFIGPARSGGDRFVALIDDCPLPSDERWIAHEAQSIGVALEFACRTDHVVFGPRVAARRLLETGALVEIAVAGWDVSDPLYVVCNSDRVLARVRAAVMRVAREEFGD